MKVRTDFVSNSSSSSFVLLGKIFSAKELLDQLKAKCKEDNPKFLEELELDYGDDDTEKLYELLDKYLSKTNLEQEFENHDSGIEDINVCIGVNPGKMSGNQTLNEFKEKIAGKITKIGLGCEKSEVEFVSGGSDASGYSWFGCCG